MLVPLHVSNLLLPLLERGMQFVLVRLHLLRVGHQSLKVFCDDAEELLQRRTDTTHLCPYA